MKAILLILLFTMITSLGHQPNLRSFRIIPRRAPKVITTEPNLAEEFYNNPPDEYKTAKEYFDKDNHFVQLMEKLQNKNNRIEESYTLCQGYSPIEYCEAFVNEIAKRL